MILMYMRIDILNWVRLDTSTLAGIGETRSQMSEKTPLSFQHA